MIRSSIAFVPPRKFLMVYSALLSVWTSLVATFVALLINRLWQL